MQFSTYGGDDNPQSLSGIFGSAYNGQGLVFSDVDFAHLQPVCIRMGSAFRDFTNNQTVQSARNALDRFNAFNFQSRRGEYAAASSTEVLTGSRSWSHWNEIFIGTDLVPTKLAGAAVLTIAMPVLLAE